MLTFTEFRQKCQALVDSKEYDKALLSPIGMLDTYSRFKSNYEKSSNKSNGTVLFETIERFKL